MKRLLPFAVVVAGCSGAEPPKPAEPPLVVAVVPTPDEPTPPELPTPPAEPFRFPADRAGPSLERALLPAPPSPAGPSATGPKPRATDITRGELPLTKPTPAIGPTPLTARRSPIPSAPADGVPVEFGGVPVDLSGYRFPEGKPVRVPDRPPPTSLPMLARRWTDRVPTDDPSAEVSADRIVRTLLPPPLLTGPLLRLMVPDPFELAEQVRPPAGPELATTPVEVPPGRP